MRLKDKVVVVTGSTTGIGEAIARACVAAGARVVVHGRDRGRGEALVRELGERAVFCCNDLAEAASARELVETAVSSFGQLDAIVNNAANTQRSSIETTTVEFFDRMIATNLRAPLLLVQAALSQLKRMRGCVLNIGSVNGYCGEPNLLAYSVSKGGLMTLSRNLADALGRDGIRVNHFNVGWVLTPNEYKRKISEGLPEGWDKRLPLTAIPSGRMTTPQEVAAMAVFWISDESRPFSGSVIDLDQFPWIGRNPPKEM